MSFRVYIHRRLSTADPRLVLGSACLHTGLVTGDLFPGVLSQQLAPLWVTVHQPSYKPPLCLNTQFPLGALDCLKMLARQRVSMGLAPLKACGADFYRAELNHRVQVTALTGWDLCDPSQEGRTSRSQHTGPFVLCQDSGPLGPLTISPQ